MVRSRPLWTVLAARLACVPPMIACVCKGVGLAIMSCWSEMHAAIAYAS